MLNVDQRFSERNILRISLRAQLKQATACVYAACHRRPSYVRRAWLVLEFRILSFLLLSITVANVHLKSESTYFYWLQAREVCSKEAVIILQLNVCTFLSLPHWMVTTSLFNIVATVKKCYLISPESIWDKKKKKNQTDSSDMLTALKYCQTTAGTLCFKFGFKVKVIMMNSFTKPKTNLFAEWFYIWCQPAGSTNHI